MRENQADKAYKEIRHLLIAQSLRPGDRLTEQKLAQRLELNRASIKIALSRLFSEGMVCRGKQGGFFVRQYSEEEIYEANEARLVLEIGAAKLAVERASKHDIEELEKVAMHMKIMAENGYESGLSEADVRFHETLVKAAHNMKLVQVYEHANIPITINKEVPQNKLKEEMLEDAELHHEMVKALKAKKELRLFDLLRKGLEKGRNFQNTR